MARRRSPSLNRILRRLQELPEEVTARFDQVLEREVGEMVTAMRLKVRHKTGKLRRSIVYEKLGPLRYKVKAGGKETTKPVRPRGIWKNFKYGVRRGAGLAKAEYDYAASEEWGTGKKKASPFFYTTYRARKKRMLKVVRDSIKRSIK